MLLPWLFGLRLRRSLRAGRAFTLLAVRLLDRLQIVRLTGLVMRLASALLRLTLPVLGCAVFMILRPASPVRSLLRPA